MLRALAANANFIVFDTTAIEAASLHFQGEHNNHYKPRESIGAILQIHGRKEHSCNTFKYFVIVIDYLTRIVALFVTISMVTNKIIRAIIRLSLSSPSVELVVIL